MATLFSKIANGEIPCHKIAEDEHHFAFLDINPVGVGHTLVIPKKEVSYIFDLPEDEYKALWSFAKGVAAAVEKAIPCKRIGITVIGLEVPHTHIHLVPLTKEGDMNFAAPKMNPSQEELSEIAEKISSEYKKLNS